MTRSNWRKLLRPAELFMLRAFFYDNLHMISPAVLVEFVRRNHLSVATLPPERIRRLHDFIGRLQISQDRTQANVVIRALVGLHLIDELFERLLDVADLGFPGIGRVVLIKPDPFKLN